MGFEVVMGRGGDKGDKMQSGPDKARPTLGSRLGQELLASPIQGQPGPAHSQLSPSP
jgi:hypothetical protein